MIDNTLRQNWSKPVSILTMGVSVEAHPLSLGHMVIPPDCMPLPSPPRMPAVKSNDMMMVIYLSTLIRSVLALHKLIDNKEQRLWAEAEATAGKDKEGGKKDDKAVAAAAGADKDKAAVADKETKK